MRRVVSRYPSRIAAAQAVQRLRHALDRVAAAIERDSRRHCQLFGPLRCSPDDAAALVADAARLAAHVDSTFTDC